MKTKPVERFVTKAAGVYLLVILLMVTFCEKAFRGLYHTNSLLRNAALLPIALAVGVCLWLCVRRCGTSGDRFAKRLWIWFAALLAVQLVIARSIWFYPGWDVESVYTSAQALARGEALDQAYFRLCGNNAPLTVLLSVPLWLADRLGMAVPYAVLPYLGAISTNAACFVGMLCVCRLTENAAARWFALIAETAWIALSAMMTIPYTDTFAVLFPMLAFYTFLGKRKPFVRWLLISLFCGIGAMIKPTVMIVWIAMLLLTAIRRLPWQLRSRAFWRRAGSIALALLLGVLPCKLMEKAALQLTSGTTSADGQLGAAHYLMMGMNGETYGGHSPDDVAYTTSFPTAAEKTSADLSRAWERLRSRSLAENLRFFAIKAYKSFSDGTFAMAGSFIIKEDVIRTDTLSVLLRNVYRERGDWNRLFSTVEQGIWLLLLSMCALGFLLGESSRFTAVMALTLVGLSCYLLLFETWPRYIFVYAPLFVAAATGALTIRRRGASPAAD